jgi:hypothetical protein
VKRRDHHEVTRKYDDLSNKNGISCWFHADFMVISWWFHGDVMVI